MWPARVLRISTRGGVRGWDSEFLYLHNVCVKYSSVTVLCAAICRPEAEEEVRRSHKGLRKNVPCHLNRKSLQSNYLINQSLEEKSDLDRPE